MIRAALFVALLLGMAYVVFFQAEKAKQHDLDKAQNQIDQTREQVKKTVDDYQDKLQENMKEQIDQ